jgi:hypothetical protein
MHKHLSRRRRLKVSSLLLAMLLFRAYVPVGFMPASGTPFLLELCPAAAPMPMDMGSMHDMASMPMAAHHLHTGIHEHFDNCPFGSAPGAGPLSSHVVFEPPGRLASHFRFDGETSFLAARATRAHRARAPPSLV